MMKKVCLWCRSKEFRRVNRRNVFQRTVLALVGLYPWECVICRHRMFYFDDGHRPSRRGSL